METNFHIKYFESISFGLNSIKYKIYNKIVDSSILFTKIKNELKKLKKNGGRVYFLGNGASSAFANHMALDFMKNGKIISRSLSDSSLLTALSNDYSYEQAMVEFLKIENLNENDFVITISSSGNSPNIVSVLNYCKLNKISNLALSGLNENNKSNLNSYYSIYVPMKTYGMVECIHQILLHLILDDFMEITEWNRDNFQNMNSNSFTL